MGKTNIAVIILAAGKGTRMKSEVPKVLHEVCGRPMLLYCLDLVRKLKPYKTVAVLGYKHEEVRKYLPVGVKVAIQKTIAGTADAVKQAIPELKGFSGTVLVLYADTPLLKESTLRALLARKAENDADAVLLTANLDNPSGYGRILRDKYSCICGIAEDKDADAFQKEIKEINTGIMCFDAIELTKALRRVKPQNQKKEYYLTDVIGIFHGQSRLIESVNLKDINEALGVNSRVDLAQANGIMQKIINKKLMEEGVTIVDPSSTFINYGTKIGPDTIIYPFTVTEKNVIIGKRCSIGPFVHLRENTHIKDNVLVGNFLELVRSRIGKNSFMKHFAYIGDSIVGAGVNIGAGTVTANFDGKKKNLTVIKDNAFIGSHTVLVAPVKVGKAAKTGAGSIVLRNTNIADNAVVAGVPARSLKKSG